MTIIIVNEIKDDKDMPSVKYKMTEMLTVALFYSKSLYRSRGESHFFGSKSAKYSQLIRRHLPERGT